MATNAGAGVRVAALAGPGLSGKTTLLESLAAAASGKPRDSRSRRSGAELAAVAVDYLGDRWHLLDCPGSIEMLAETQAALSVADLVVVVCEPAPDKALMLAPLFKILDDAAIPHMVFVNKMETLAGTEVRARDVLAALQAVSVRPLVLRQVPIRDGAGTVGGIVGAVDLVSERAYRWKPGGPSDLVALPGSVHEREREARQTLMEALADFDDALLEQLLEDVTPEPGALYDHLAKDFARDLIVPVFLGSAERDNGVRRLWKAMRHEGPSLAQTRSRRQLDEEAGGAVVQVFKTSHVPHVGKLSVGRIWQGTITDGMTLGGERVSGLYRLTGTEQAKLPQAEAGDIVALGRMDGVRSGDLLRERGATGRAPHWPEPPQPVYALAVASAERSDDVKLSAALQKLAEEDPSLSVAHGEESGEVVLWGQGDVHLQGALERLSVRHNIQVRTHLPQIGYRETIRKSAADHARFKRQTGGHGQFADIHVEIRPLPRGEGFRFDDAVVGGAVPRQFIPAVEAGVRDALARGPLGFPVVDMAVKLTGGQFHAVDSSEMAFRTVARQAMAEIMPKCEPVLLEPILAVSLLVPGEFTARAQRLVSGRRGQILGFDARPGWPGWDEVRVHMPEAETRDLILELRSLTLGVGTFTWAFDHLAELVGRLADRAVEQHHATAAQ